MAQWVDILAMQAYWPEFDPKNHTEVEGKNQLHNIVL